MTGYFLRRVLLIIPTLWIAVTVLFFLLRLIPGDAVTVLFANAQYSQAEAKTARAQLGLSDPVYVQYAKFVKQAVTGDFGRSIFTGKDVTTEFLKQRFPVTLELGVLSMLMGMAFGITIGVIAAIKQNSIVDYVGRTLAIAGLSVPGFWIATLAIILPSYWWHWSLPIGYQTIFANPINHAQQMLIPAFVMSLFIGATLMRYTRAMMIETLRQDYVRTARAKGLKERVVIVRHSARNAMIPLISVIGVQAAFIVGGTIIFESIFSLPGVGSYVFQGLSRRDYPVVQGVAVFLTVWVLLVNLAVDLTYPWFDPRVTV